MVQFAKFSESQSYVLPQGGMIEKKSSLPLCLGFEMGLCVWIEKTVIKPSALFTLLKKT